MKKSKLILLIIISAVLSGLSRYDLPLDFLAFFAFIPLFRFFQLAVDELESKKFKDKLLFCLITGSIYSIVFLTISVHWISLVTLGGFIGILVLYSFYYMFFFMLLIWGISRYKKHFAHFIILGFVSLEFILSYGPFKFPWLNIGYSLSHSIYLLQVLEYGGVYLLSFLILVINYLLFIYLFKSKKKWHLLTAFIIMIIWWTIGYYRYHSIETSLISTKAGIVQVSIPQEMKWEAAFLDSTVNLYKQKTIELVQKDSIDLVVYPEAAIPLYLMQWESSLDDMLLFANKVGVNIFTGFPHYENGVKYKMQPEPYLFYNASSQFKPNLVADSMYCKNQLVPFGERIPFLEYFPILWKLQFGQANFEHGDGYRYYQVKRAVYSPLICYEVIFPDYVRKMVNPRLDFIVNITNDAWFKRSIGTYQHKMMCVYRAIENRRSIFRAANTGYSVIVSPRGDISQELGLYEVGTISSQIEVCKKISFYQKYGYIFPLLILFSFFIEFVLTFFLSYGKRHI
ncbi:MAG TPA: apolipoprotein N-acyltransferase [Candidatus Cloacimonadota bacterium]|nr:apolipoprotein N-acyltransferase [Candidatus Cloacimonadota bacterium]